MKLVIFLLIFVYINADVVEIINNIKFMENYKHQYSKFINYNPFKKVVFKKSKNNKLIFNSVNKSRKFYINAIFNNKVMINKKWYKTGDYINDWKIIKINYNKIILKKSNKYKILKYTPKIIKVSK